MVLVLLAVSVFAVVGSQVTAAASAEAVAASSLSEDYWRAATAVGAVESLERKYRLEPGPACGRPSTGPRPRSPPRWPRSSGTGTWRTGLSWSW
jgi:hypothetical protein